MFQKIKQIWNSKELRKKILFTLGIVALFRLLAQISIPGANIAVIKEAIAQNQLLGMFSLFTGGGTENFSIILMGLSPYINASIIIQLLTVIVPKLENLSKEGDQGRKKLNQYTRLLTVPLAILQSYGMILLLNSQTSSPIITDISKPSVILPIMLTVTAGTVLCMWLGEMISEKGIGNGVSILIFTGIVASIPPVLVNNFMFLEGSAETIIPMVTMIMITILLTILVILVTEAERRIPVIYATRGSRSKGEKSNLPIRINQAGMVPIIFSASVVSFPGIIAQFLSTSTNEQLKAISEFIQTNFTQTSLYYSIIYFVLIVAFTYFYVSITFNPEQVAENIQKRGGYIPGIRPGKQTVEYLSKISNRLNLFGGLFIAMIAISPNLISLITPSTSFGQVSTLITGAGLIIAVGVILELIRQVNSQLVMHDYNKLY